LYIRDNLLRVHAAALILAALPATAQPPQPPPLTAAQIAAAQVHIDAARALAADDLAVPFDFFCEPGNARANNLAAPALTPVKLFGNLYAVGNSESVVYALTTSDGIVLFDAGMPMEMEGMVLPGLVALGLDPADIRYVLLGHGHVDHFGGSALLQERYGARVGTTAADWDLIAQPAPNQQGEAPPKPTRDLVLSEAEALTVGDTTITFVEIPGHTPGALAFIFPVSDGGTEHVAGLFGGTALTFGFIQTPALTNYVESIAHYRAIAERMQVDVEIQNHPIFDDTPARLAALATRAPGAAHPFVMGNERYLRFWNVISECMQAEVARRAAAQ
jgi:metallo-beta-lactamase class B